LPRLAAVGGPDLDLLGGIVQFSELGVDGSLAQAAHHRLGGFPLAFRGRCRRPVSRHRRDLVRVV
jgi:hypothetical protein